MSWADVDGRPLAPGDWVLIVGGARLVRGMVAEVAGPSRSSPEMVRLELLGAVSRFAPVIRPANLQKLDKDAPRCGWPDIARLWLPRGRV